MSTADGYVLPKPGIPKTLGILNVIFGVLLVLLGICGIGSLLAAPAAMQFMEKAVKEGQAKAEAQNQAQLKQIDDRLAASKDDEEKKAIQQERDAIATSQVKVNPVDMSAATDVLKDPTIMAYSYGTAITGLVLHVLLLISGIGLIRLRPWGRTLGLAWGGLQIVQILIMLVANVMVVLPLNQANTAKQIAKIQAAAKAPGAGPADASAAQMVEVMGKMAVPMAVGQSLGGMIYPIILLILLNTQGARAACLARKPESIDGI